jgi:hypothetical protein
MSQPIPPDEVRWEAASLVDPVGRLFWWRGDIYRAIRPEHAAFYRKLFETERLRALCARHLTRTVLTSLSLEGFGLVLQHERVPFVSYCMEWSPEMLRDAALLVCDLGADLLDNGLALKDAHGWNVLFDGPRPVFVDWGSLAPDDGSHPWPHQEYQGRFLAPLYLMAAGRSGLARTLSLDVTRMPARGDVFRLLLGRVPWPQWLPWWQEDREDARGAATPAFFRRLRKRVESIKLRPVATEWTDYAGPRHDHEPSDRWPVRTHNIHRLLQTLRPSTVLDVACNRGWFSELAARQGAQVVALDIDEGSIDALYRYAQQRRLPILPLVMDVCAPTPAHGLAAAYPAAGERLQADLILALALTHHLVFKRRLSFATIAQQLSVFSKRCLVTEFVPAEDEHVRRWTSAEFSWYRLEGFLDALRPLYRKIEILESSPAPRVLVACER